MEIEELDITKRRRSEQILPVPCDSLYMEVPVNYTSVFFV